MTVRTIRPEDTEKDTHHGEDVDYVEYGILLPDGNIIWGHIRDLTFSVRFDQLYLPKSRELAQRDYNSALRRLGITEERELRFVQRRQQIRYTEAEILSPYETLV